jgi:hypothetical protein
VLIGGKGSVSQHRCFRQFGRYQSIGPDGGHLPPSQCESGTHIIAASFVGALLEHLGTGAGAGAWRSVFPWALHFAR